MSDDRTRLARDATQPPPPAEGDSTRVASASAGAQAPDAGFLAGEGAAHKPAPPVQVGEVLGHTYRIEAFLAKGGMGAVYRARHVVLESEHAIKIILSELSEDPQIIALLNQEARTLRTVKNDAVVEYQGLMLDEYGRRYLVMEFVDGPSLASVLRQRRFTPDEVRTLRDRLALGLAAAHDKGIYHRDISPDNIILPGGRIENAKIIDFGIAKSTATGEKTLIGGDFAGKFSFASPEQAGMHGGKVDARSDIYSLGLVLASAAIGQGGKLDMGSSLGSVVEARQKVPDLSALPQELRGEIAAMLQPKPEDRPQSMRDIVGLGVKGSRGAGAGDRVAPARRSASPMVMVVAALSFAGVVALGAAYFLLVPAQRPAATPPSARAAAPTTAVQPPPPPSLAATPPPPPQVAAVSPPPPARAPDLVAEVRQITEGFSCAELKPTLVADGGVRIDGFVSSADDLARLRSAVGGLAGAARLDAVAIYGWPHCEVIKLLDDTALPGAADSAPVLAFNRPDRLYRGGDTLIVTASATTAYAGYLYVDYLDNDGNVVHLLPMPQHPGNAMNPGQSITLGTTKEGGRRGARVYEISEPFGPNLVMAISSPKPLFEARPESESAKDYLPVLTRALKAAAQSGGRVVASYQIISTVPR